MKRLHKICAAGTALASCSAALLLSSIFTLASAQTVSDVSASREGNCVAVSYRIDRPSDFISLSVSTDGGATFSRPLKKVSGDVGPVAAGLHRIVWDVLSEFDSLTGDNIVFKVTASAQGLDLSASGTANCYIVSKPGDYKFKGTVKGNSSESVGAPVSAEVLWESFGTSAAPGVGDIVRNVSYSDGYVKFSTPSSLKDGNAVIAVKSSTGEILWSWHIWVCNGFDPASTAQTYNNGAGKMMDRNLGATSSSKGSVGALGLLYQWGRKDPFLGSSSIDSDTEAKSTISWPLSVSSTSSTGKVSYAVAHPTTFIIYNSCNYDWYYSGTSSTDNTRWTSSKTKYDPCPPGWRVPDGWIGGVWPKAFGTISYWTTSSNWDSGNRGMDFGITDRKLGYGTIWFPASGYRYHSSGSLLGVGIDGLYRSCTPLGNSACTLYFRDDGLASPSDLSHRACGQSVRCLSE